jgi:hypothetical protein
MHSFDLEFLTKVKRQQNLKNPLTSLAMKTCQINAPK